MKFASRPPSIEFPNLFRRFIFSQRKGLRQAVILLHIPAERRGAAKGRPLAAVLRMHHDEARTMIFEPCKNIPHLLRTREAIFVDELHLHRRIEREIEG